MDSHSPYATILNEPRPQHEWDDFSIRHPKMSRASRAKIFMPYDALKGYKEAVRSKEIHYEAKMSLSEEEAERLNRKLGLLLSAYTKAKKAGVSVFASVCYFMEVPLTDEDILLGENPYVVRGLYREITGAVQKIDEYGNLLTIGGEKIAFENIVELSGEWVKTSID